MSSKLNSEKKNNNGNHGKHSSWFAKKEIEQKKHRINLMTECHTNFPAPRFMKRLKKYPKELPETTVGYTFGLNQRYSKRRKIEHYQEKLINDNFIGPLNAENQTIISVKDFRTLKFKPESYKTKHPKTYLLFPKLNPEIVLDFIKHPSVNKLKVLLDLMYTESVHYHKYSKELTDHEQSRRISIELKKYLFELCYQKFCELWLHKTADISLLSTKQHKRFLRTKLRHTRCTTSKCNINLKKLILYNGGLTGYPKKPHLLLCISIIFSVFTTLLKRRSRMLCKENKKKANSKNYNRDEIQSIKLYKKGTTKKKSFLDIVNEYKHIIKTDRLSFYQVADIKHAYEGILEPGQYITKEDLDICADENYRFKIDHNISSNENNDGFVFDDIEDIPNSEFNSLYSIPSPKIENCFKTVKFPSLLEYVKGVQPINHFGLKCDKKNGSIEAIETEVRIQSTSTEDHNIDKDISTDDLERKTVTNYSGAGTSSENLGLERATNTLVKKRNSSNNYSKISERLNNKLFSHPITLTKSEKRMLSTIIFAGMNPYKVKWKRRNSSERTRLFQIIVYFGSLKMGLCDKLHLDRLDLKGKNICDMIDIEKLLRSIQVESCVLQECFTFTEGENFLIWPLGKMIVNNIISQRSPTINILFSFVKNIITKFCEKVKDFCRKSGLRIVLNKESLFESLSNVRIGKDVLNTELSLKYANVHTYPLPVNNNVFSNDAPGTSNSEHFCVTNTGFCIKKNSSNEEICKSMVNILKSDDSIHQSWKECNNSHRFISKLLKAGVTLPIKESNTGHGSKFVEVYVRWFCEEYLEDDKFYKLAVSILKNIFLYIDTASGCTDIKIEDAINNALMILYDQPCFAKAYESYLNTKLPKCLSSSKHDRINDTENRSDYKDVNIRAIEELQIEPNVNVQTDPIDTNNVDMSLVPSTSNVFNVLNNATIKNLVTPDLQSTNYDINSDFLQNLINENSNDLMENIGIIDDTNNIFNNPETIMMDMDDPNFNNILGFNEFNEDSPFDDAIPTTVMSLDYNLSNSILESDNLEFQLTKNMEDITQEPINSIDPFIVFGEKDEEINLQFQQAKNMEEVSMISSDQLVYFDQNDEINLNELMETDIDNYGFYNAGVLLPP